jgi:hypothetical protein
MSDYRSEIDQWADMWDEMSQDSVINPPMQKPEPSPWASQVLGLGSSESENPAQDSYYDYLDSEELFQEEKTPNPVYPDSVGPDQNGPKPVWVDEKLLKEIEGLKTRLFKVENQMARMGQGKKLAEKKVHSFNDKSMFAEIKAIRDRIEKVSSQLGIKNEPSPWQIKRD